MSKSLLDKLNEWRSGEIKPHILPEEKKCIPCDDQIAELETRRARSERAMVASLKNLEHALAKRVETTP